MRVGTTAGFLAVALALLIACAGCGQGGGGASGSVGGGPGTGPAPGFTLASLDGQNVSLDTYKGKVVLVDFWATWCGPCRMSIPHLVDLQRKYGEQGFQVIGISLDRTGAGTIGAFAQKYGINYPVVIGTPDVVTAYGGVRSIPQAFIIDRSGSIREQIVGYRPMAELDEKVKNLL